MKKINCDFCNKDITNDYTTDDNVRMYYDEEFDLCDDCMEEYRLMCEKASDLRKKLWYEYNEKIEDEIKQFTDKKIKELKE